MPSRHEWCNPLAALRTVIAATRSTKVTVAMQQALRVTPEVEVTLPGFNLFSSDNSGKAVDWMMPKVRGDIETLLSVYEEYADRRLGRAPAPDRVARQAFTDKVGRAILGKPRVADQWWVPAAMLIALAYRTAPAALGQGEDWLTLDLGAYRMELRYNAMWSNFHGRLCTTTAVASDADIHAFDVEPLTTSHPLAVAAVKHKLPASALWAINSLLRSDPKFEIVSLASERLAASGLRPRRARAKSRTRWDSWDSLRAYEELTAMLEGGEPQPIGDLYKLAVPLAMSARDFKNLVGCPWQRPDRLVYPRVQKRLKEHLDST